jgi:tRNA (cmo5U34)-methyltransferase
VSEGWDPGVYLDVIRAEIPRYEELQERAVEAAAGLPVRVALELGVGTGETARRLLRAHPGARLVGIDGNEAMLSTAREALPPERVELRLGRLEDPLPAGPFDLVVSVLAVHHLRGDEKAALFRRVAAVLEPGGRFVLADVVVPERPEDAVIPLEEGFDLPDSVVDQLAWLADAGLDAEVAWSAGDLAILVAERPRSRGG